MFKEELLKELKMLLIDRSLCELDDEEVLDKKSLNELYIIFDDLNFEDEDQKDAYTSFINDLYAYCQSESEENESNLIYTKNEFIQSFVEVENENNYENSDTNIFLDKVSISIKELNNNYNDGEYVIPQFQRKAVWRKEKICNFIDSISKGYPIPPIFIYEDSEGISEVIDGYQRLKSINYFISGDKDKSNNPKIRLKFGNSSLNSLNNKRFEDLTEVEKRKFLNKSIMVFKITPTTDDIHKVNYLKLNIFNKLNTGGENLNRMEARRALSFSDSQSNIIKNLENIIAETSWQDICGISNKRFKSLEFLFRIYVFSKTIDVKNKSIFYSKSKNNIHYSNIPNFLDKYLIDYKNDFEFSFKDKIINILNDISELDFTYGKGKKANYIILDSFLIGLLLVDTYNKNTLQNKLEILKEIDNRDGKDEKIAKYFDDKSGTMLLDSILHRVSKSIEILKED